MGLIRIWSEVDPMDPLTKYLGYVAGFRPEGEVRQPDGSVRLRYSSIA
jgi:hypothetical protein